MKEFFTNVSVLQPDKIKSVRQKPKECRHFPRFYSETTEGERLYHFFAWVDYSLTARPKIREL